MLQPGESIDIWVVESALGTGGMGSVYRCHNRSASRILAAIKVLEGGLHRYPEAEARFVREAEILFQLDHPNIVKVRNIRTETDPPYLEMEFVAGEALDERLYRGPMAYRESLDVVKQVASAIEYLHVRGVRHRDIKPANVLVMRDGGVKLVDFGLAVEADHSRITQQGIAFGTVSYAPPEWIAPETMDPVKWDIYALGVVFYEMLAGKLAFPVSGQGTARQQAMQVIVAKQGHAPLDPGDAYHDDVRQLIGDMTQPDAANRVGDAREVVRRLAALRPEPRRAVGATLAPNNPFQTGPIAQEGTVSMEVRSKEPSPSPAPARAAATTPLPSVGIAPVALAFGGIGAFAIGLVTVLGIGGAAMWWYTSAPASRPVRIVAAAVPADVPLDVTVSAGVSAGRGPDGAVSFTAVPPGPLEVRWAVGAGCGADACATGTCGAWCAHGVDALQVEPGTAELPLTIPAAPPPARAVAIAVGLPREVALRAELGGVRGARTPTGVEFVGVAPGAHPLVIAVEGCAEPACTVSESVVVPVVGDPTPAAVTLAAPATAPGPAPPTAPAAPRPKLPRLVKAADLKAWLDAHPGRTGWAGTSDRSGNATGVPPTLARAYCGERGLQTVSGPPRTEDEGLTYEIRMDGSRYVFVAPGMDQAPLGPSQVMRTAVFRCSR